MTMAMLLILAQLHMASTQATGPTAMSANAHNGTPIPALVMLGVGGAAVLAGVLIGATTFIPTTTELDALCPQHHCGEAARPVFDRAQSIGLIANLASAIGALYVVAGASWWIAARFDRATAPVRITPLVHADGATLFVVGSF